MAFQSFSDIAKKQRKGSGRPPQATKSLLSMTQKSYPNNEKRSVMTIRITAEAMEKARFKQGDKVDIAYDGGQDLWQIAMLDDQTKSGYAISCSKDSPVGTVRFSIYEGMKTIAKTQPANSSRIFTQDKTVKLSPGRIIFGLNKDTLVVRPDESPAVQESLSID